MDSLLNWYAGWALILVGFMVGIFLGLFFHRDEFLGGYTTWPRRLTRLGHIALIALGGLNILYSLAPSANSIAGQTLLAGSVAMPAVCFASAWKKSLRHLFGIPVGLLMLAVALTILSGPHL
jgi:hypothetical protein